MNMKRIGLIAAALLGLGAHLFGQKFVQYERAHRARTLKFYAGDELTYRFRGDTFWRTSLISDVDMQTQRVSFDGRYVPLSEVYAIRLQYPGLVRASGPMLMLFGASWAGFSLIGAVFDDYPLTAQTAIISGTGLVVGFGLKQLFKHRSVRLNERRRLRAVEIPVSIPLRPGF